MQFSQYFYCKANINDYEKNHPAFFIFLGFTVNAQGYIITADDEIYRLEPDFSTTYITTVNLPQWVNLMDIAISPSGVFYGASSMGWLIQIDPTTGNYTELAGISAETGLVCTANNELYYIKGDKLWKYDLLTQTAQMLSDIPAYTPGDLVQRQRSFSGIAVLRFF